VQSKRTTSLAGVASITLLPVDNTSLSVSYAGSATEAATESKAMIHVRQAVGIRSPAARLGAAYGHKILVWGAVAPGYFTMVQPAPTYYATIQWRDASDWHRQLRVKLQLQKLPNGRVDFGYVARFVPGSRHLRTTVPGGPGDERGISRVLYIPRPR
jgi:hypothetical protein